MTQPHVVTVNDKIQHNYHYVVAEPMGKNFHESFAPDLSPSEMLRLGIFGGKYLNDCQDEFPTSWFKGVKFSEEGHDPELNYFKVNASQPLSVWIKKGWIYHEDPRGWFQWYCRYYMGRRIPREDDRQIKRWRAMRRHLSQIQKNCHTGDITCRPKQRQALLHWAYDTRKV